MLASTAANRAWGLREDHDLDALNRHGRESLCRKFGFGLQAEHLADRIAMGGAIVGVFEGHLDHLHPVGEYPCQSQGLERAGHLFDGDVDFVVLEARLLEAFDEVPHFRDATDGASLQAEVTFVITFQALHPKVEGVLYAVHRDLSGLLRSHDDSPYERGRSPVEELGLDPGIGDAGGLHLLVDVLEGEFQAAGVDLAVAELQLGGRILVLHVLEVTRQEPTSVVVRHFPSRFVAAGFDAGLELFDGLGLSEHESREFDEVQFGDGGSGFHDNSNLRLFVINIDHMYIIQQERPGRLIYYISLHFDLWGLTGAIPHGRSLGSQADGLNFGGRPLGRG